MYPPANKWHVFPATAQVNFICLERYENAVLIRILLHLEVFLARVQPHPYSSLICLSFPCFSHLWVYFRLYFTTPCITLLNCVNIIGTVKMLIFVSIIGGRFTNKGQFRPAGSNNSHIRRVHRVTLSFR